MGLPSFAQICGVAAAALLTFWAAQKISDYVSPPNAVVENPVLVPVYELKRRKGDAWTARFGRITVI